MTFAFIRASFVVIAFLAAASPAYPGTVLVPGVAGGLFSVKVTSLKERRFRSTIKQQFDFSCGSAALATLLSYHYDDPVTEQEVFDAMYEVGNKEKIRLQGFSLLDMKKYLEARGYRAGGYEGTIDTLAKVRVPAIVLLSLHGYKHFVVVKGVSEKAVVVGDPALGTRTIPRDEFSDSWNGLLFLIQDRADVAKTHFNSDGDWKVRPEAPMESSLLNSHVNDMTLFLR